MTRTVTQFYTRSAIQRNCDVKLKATTMTIFMMTTTTMMTITMTTMMKITVAYSGFHKEEGQIFCGHFFGHRKRSHGPTAPLNKLLKNCDNKLTIMKMAIRMMIAKMTCADYDDKYYDNDEDDTGEWR